MIHYFYVKSQSLFCQHNYHWFLLNIILKKWFRNAEFKWNLTQLCDTGFLNVCLYGQWGRTLKLGYHFFLLKLYGIIPEYLDCWSHSPIHKSQWMHIWAMSSVHNFTLCAVWVLVMLYSVHVQLIMWLKSHICPVLVPGFICKLKTSQHAFTFIWTFEINY